MTLQKYNAEAKQNKIAEFLKLVYCLKMVSVTKQDYHFKLMSKKFKDKLKHLIPNVLKGKLSK